MTEPDHPASAEPGRGPNRADEGAGLRDAYPRLSGVGGAVGVGGLWGVLCYSVLWEGRPFGVDRPFVESVFGTLLLLPARLVLWVMPLAPAVTPEAVIAADPEVIAAGGVGDTPPEWLDDWRRWKQMTAVKRGNLFFVPPDLIQRHTPRLAEGAERLCAHLETARGRR